MKYSIIWALIALAPYANLANAITIQNAGDVVDGAPFLWVEGEDAALGNRPSLPGWVVVDKNSPITLPNGLDALPETTDASGGKAIFMEFGSNNFPNGTTAGDQSTATWDVRFTTEGTYRLYLRYSKYDADNNNSYANEDSIHLPPDFGRSSTNGWIGFEGEGWPGGLAPTEPPVVDIGDSVRDGWMPLTGNIKSAGTTVLHNDAAGEPEFWNGHFHWRLADIGIEVAGSAFVDDFGQKLQYKVTPDRVGQDLTFEISIREHYGVIDGLLFVALGQDQPDLLDVMSQEELTDAVLSRQSNPCDLNGDGAVDAADAGIMFADWGGPGSTSIADKNQDGFVDAADAGVMFEAWTGDPNVPAAKAATAEYDPATGELKISSAGAVNVFVQSASNAITPVSPAPAVPVGLLTNNSGRVGITNLGPIEVTNFSFGNIGKGLAMSDLKLVYTTALGTKGIEVPAGLGNDAAFRYIPEPASLGLLGLGLLGYLSARRRS